MPLFRSERLKKHVATYLRPNGEVPGASAFAGALVQPSRAYWCSNLMMRSLSAIALAPGVAGWV